jgi:50S ribosomal protein L16 3-hydroxylase
MTRPLDLQQPCAFLGGLSPARFMREHWQKKPLLVRQAFPGIRPPVSRTQVAELAMRDDVESRLVSQGDGGWRLRHGPIPARGLPPFKRSGWTVLLQGLNLHVPAADELMSHFRFVPDARLDDLMLSYATDGGGVGPHLDSYDVFLIQVHGQRRWRIGRVPDDRLVEGVPLKILAAFEPEDEWLLEPGDMLYLPPRWGHDGVAVGECMTCSVGFRAPSRQGLAADLLGRLADEAQEAFAASTPRLYEDRQQAATVHPAQVPSRLTAFARSQIARWLTDEQALANALGEILTEPKPIVSFEAGEPLSGQQGLVLAAATRMLYDDTRLFINGESFRVGGSDAVVLRHLADDRCLSASQFRSLSKGARQVLSDWSSAGWIRAQAGS